MEEHNRQRLAALAIALASLTLALSVARPRTTPGPLMRDFEAYYAAGQAWKAGADAYSVAIWRFEKRVPGVRSDPPEVLPFIGPPTFLPLWAALGALPFAGAVRVWAVLIVVPLLGALAMLLRRLHAWDPGSFLSAAALCVGFGPLTSGFALGQAALPVFALVVLATGFLATNLLAGGVAAFFAGLQPNLWIALLSQARHRNVLATLGITVLALVTFGLLFAGFAGFLHYFSALRAHGAAERYAVIQFTPSAIAYGFGIPTAAANVLGVVVAVAAVAVWIAMMAQRRLTRWWRLAITCALLPFAVPFFHEHDFVIALVPAFMCLCAASRRTWAVGGAATMLVGIDWLGLAQRPEALPQSLLLTLALLAAIFAFSDQPLGLHRFAILAALLLIPAGLLAQHFPAPIWPDAMQVHAIAAGPSMAAVWNAELRAAHQVSPQPLWAALRLMTLAGAGLLAWCAIRTAHRHDHPSTSSG